MNFNETVMYRILSVPSDEWNKSCGYIFALKIPVLMFALFIWIILAFIVDFYRASSEIFK